MSEYISNEDTLILRTNRSHTLFVIRFIDTIVAQTSPKLVEECVAVVVQSSVGMTHD